jgi:hypothetical protein
MSLLWVLRKYIDPVGHRQVQEDLRRQREDWPPDANPNDVDLKLRPAPASAQVYRCRLCGAEGPEPRYCHFCLAETMKPVE